MTQSKPASLYLQIPSAAINPQSHKPVKLKAFFHLARYLAGSILFAKAVTANTDKKENKIFLICMEIHMGSVAKSYMRKGFLIYEEMRK
jgi:hypothetical protein